MSAGPRQSRILQLTAEIPGRTLPSLLKRNETKAWGVSLAVHLALLALIGLIIQVVREPVPSFASLQLEWEPEVSVPQFETLDSVAVVAPKSDSAESAPTTSTFHASSAVTTVEPRVRTTLLPAPDDFALSPKEMVEYVGALAGMPGEGEGNGNGDGDGLFGGSRGAGTFVFVLDQSGSMNLPLRQVKNVTRFQRLQLELMSFINQLEPTQSFYVIFFNENANPMPSGGLVPATQGNKLRYLNWIRQVTPGGRTDPRSAVRMAIKMQPEQIFFLSDGEIDPFFEQQILKHEPGSWKLSTYSFGVHGGQFMQVFAEKHGGKYTYIP
jgi:hypothetical protein